MRVTLQAVQPQQRRPSLLEVLSDQGLGRVCQQSESSDDERQSVAGEGDEFL